MKPTEAKEWIDRLVEAGLKREDATGIVDKMVTASTYLEDVVTQALQLIVYASEKRKPAEPEPPDLAPTYKATIEYNLGNGSTLYEFEHNGHTYMYVRDFMYSSGGLVHSASCPAEHRGGGE